ncbi:MAG: cation:proton antiporter [Bacilli bacterium]|nr:cation:proton antiporter [Bacilli bacterium]
MILLQMGILILIGLLFSKLCKLVKLPNVTGYLVGGLLVGPSVLGALGIPLITEDFLTSMNSISELALGFIAFTIGTQFQFEYFKRVGSGPIVIAIFESLVAVLFVFLGMVFILKCDVAFSLVLSAIAAATAPAATLMVIKQYKADGEVTKNLMSVVALDDAVALIIFGIMVAIANAINGNTTSIGWTIASPFVEVFASLAIGFVVGLLMSLLLKWFTGRSNRISVICAVILIVVSLSAVITFLNLSTLLACMMMGAVFTNTTKRSSVNTIMELCDRFTPPLLILFFTISGASLKLNILLTVGLIGVIYIVMRVIGKIFGSFLGATITKSSPTVKKWLGFALIPQAGVAIGLTIVAANVVPQYANEIRAVVLCATLIYELVGPAITKFALKKAGEITIPEKKKKEEAPAVS